jgi:hypothetical protein
MEEQLSHPVMLKPWCRQAGLCLQETVLQQGVECQSSCQQQCRCSYDQWQLAPMQTAGRGLSWYQTTASPLLLQAAQQQTLQQLQQQPAKRGHPYTQLHLHKGRQAR